MKRVFPPERREFEDIFYLTLNQKDYIPVDMWMKFIHSGNGNLIDTDPKQALLHLGLTEDDIIDVEEGIRVTCNSWLSTKCNDGSSISTSPRSKNTEPVTRVCSRVFTFPMLFGMSY